LGAPRCLGRLRRNPKLEQYSGAIKAFLDVRVGHITAACAAEKFAAGFTPPTNGAVSVGGYTWYVVLTLCLAIITVQAYVRPT